MATGTLRMRFRRLNIEKRDKITINSCKVLSLSLRFCWFSDFAYCNPYEITLLPTEKKLLLLPLEKKLVGKSHGVKTKNFSLPFQGLKDDFRQ